MCEYCGYTIGHHPRCPEYDDTADRTGEYCEQCGEPIMKYDARVQLNGKWYHLECLDKEDILEIFNIEVEDE